MAAPTYTTDLTGTGDNNENTGWIKTSATGWSSLTIDAADTDSFIQGTTATSGLPGSAAVGGAVTPALSNFTIPTDGAALAWFKYDGPSALDTEPNGGIRGVIGNSATVFYGYNLGGKDTYTYGGWTCFAFSTQVAADYTVGAVASPFQRLGVAVKPLVVPARGSPFWADAVRVGRCEARFVGGDQANGYATFGGFAGQNDLVANRWGLLSFVGGRYLWQGLMTLGYGGAVDFRDSNAQVLVANAKKVTANFSKIEIRDANSRVDWTSCNFTALGTVAKGNLEVVDDCDVNIQSCAFNGMGTFIFKSLSSVLATAFRKCGQITAGGASFAGSAFSGYEGTANTSYMVWDVDANPGTPLNHTTFTKGTAATHAIEFGTSSPTSLTLSYVTFSGYNASDNQNDSVLHIKRTAGTVSITLDNTAQPSYRSDGATVEFISSSVPVAVACKTAEGADVVGARILVKAAAGGPFPVDAPVTISTSGTTATVTHNAHGMATNDKVLINGAYAWQMNGVFTITKINDNSYSYTMPEAASSPLVLLLHCEGADASTTFTDSSGKGHNATAQANAQIDTAQFKFGSSSVYFDGSSCITNDGSADFALTDCTIDFWLKYDGAQAYGNVFQFNTVAAIGIFPDLTVHFSMNNWVIDGADTLTAGWNHIALTRSGSTIRLFLNGVIQGSYENSGGLWEAANCPSIGADPGLTQKFKGWVDEVRVINGLALWTANFAVPTAPYAITATFVALSGLSGADGTLSTSRQYTSDQPVTGWARKSSSAPYYKTAPLGGAVDSDTGYNEVATMVLDQ